MRLTLVVPVLVLAAIGCGSKKPAGPKEIAGDCKPIYGASICTWAEMADSQLVALGATIPLATIDSAPHEAAMVWPPKPALVLPLPAEARTAVGVDHLSFFWEPHGHPPSVMMTPHFDFHFYVISESARDAIDCKDLTKPASLPAGYALPDFDLPPDMTKMMGVKTMVGLCVPKMGMHAVTAEDAERTTPFQGSLIVGYIGGKPIFFEPMISKALLMQKQSFDFPMPAVAGWTGTQASKFHAEYDAQKQEYRLILSGFSAGG